MRYTLDQLLIRKWEGWDMQDYVFVSIIGDLAFLKNFNELERRKDYTGLRGMAICIVCNDLTVSEAYSEAERMIYGEADNVAIWVLGKPYVKEICFNGKRAKFEGDVFLDDGWREVVNQFAEAAA